MSPRRPLTALLSAEVAIKHKKRGIQQSASAARHRPYTPDKLIRAGTLTRLYILLRPPLPFRARTSVPRACVPSSRPISSWRMTAAIPTSILGGVVCHRPPQGNQRRKTISWATVIVFVILQG